MELRWRRGEPGRVRLLTSREGPAARLSFPGCGSLANGETAHGAWTFKREGFLHPRVSVRRSHSDIAIAVFSVSGSGQGALALGGNGHYRFGSSGWSRERWQFAPGHEPVVRFERVRTGASVWISRIETGPEALSLLCLLGWYVPLIAEADDAAAAASMAAVVACF